MEKWKERKGTERDEERVRKDGEMRRGKWRFNEGKGEMEKGRRLC